MPALSALVNQVRAVDIDNLEKRAAARRACQAEGVSRPLDSPQGLSWGAVVKDISSQGLGLSLCYPFRPGTLLVVDLQDNAEAGSSLLARVVHVRDQKDGTWHLGCELVKKLTDSAVEMVV